MTEQEQRQKVITIAESWIGTPFHFGARVKGVGVDCAHFIAAVYEEAGVFSALDWGFFGPDWHCNTTTEHYMYQLLRHAAKLPTTQAGIPGDIILAKVNAPIFDQSGILAPNGWVIQAYPRGRVCRARLGFDPLWCGWEKAYFNPWSKNV